MNLFLVLLPEAVIMRFVSAMPPWAEKMKQFLLFFAKENKND